MIKELDGLGSVPGSFFCGTVVPASQLPTRSNILGIWPGLNHRSNGPKFQYRGIRKFEYQGNSTSSSWLDGQPTFVGIFLLTFYKSESRLP